MSARSAANATVLLIQHVEDSGQMRRLPHVVQGGSPPAGTAPSSPLEPLGNDLKALVGDSAHPPSLHLASGMCLS